MAGATVRLQTKAVSTRATIAARRVDTDVSTQLARKLSTDTHICEQTVNRSQIISINCIQYSKNSKEQNYVDWTERLKKHLQLP